MAWDRSKLFTCIKQHATNSWPRGFTALDSSPHSWIIITCTSISVGSSPCSYLFTFTTIKIPVYTTPKCGKEPIRYVMPHFRGQRSTALLHNRNGSKNTFLICEQKPYPVCFSCFCQELSSIVRINIAQVSVVLVLKLLYIYVHSERDSTTTCTFNVSLGFEEVLNRVLTVLKIPWILRRVLEKSLNSIFPWKVLKFLYKFLKSPWSFFNFECCGLESIFNAFGLSKTEYKSYNVAQRN